MRSLCLFVLLYCFAISSAFAQGLGNDVNIVKSEDVSATGLTIYPDDLAFIRETRIIDLPAGLVDIQFFGVSDRIIPQSAVLEEFEGLRIEGNFDSDIINPTKLLERSVGQTLAIRRLNPVTGSTDLVRGKLVSAVADEHDITAVFSTADGIEAYQCSGLAEALILNSLPEGLNSVPVLSTRVSVREAGLKTITLTYLSRGLGWSADYRMDIDQNNKDEVGLLGWLTLNNDTSKSFKDTELSVVAGELNRVKNENRSERTYGWDPIVNCIFSKYVEDQDVVVHYAAAAPAPVASYGFAEDVIVVTASKRAEVVEATQEELGDYKLYRAPQSVTVAAHQSKQIAFLSKWNVEIMGGTKYRWDVADLIDQNLEGYGAVPGRIIYALENDKDGNLAVPLPAGTVRAMSQAPTGQNIFLGEDSIPNSAIGNPVEIEIGEAFLVTAQFTLVSENRDDVEVKVTIQNANSETVMAEFDLDFFEDLKVTHNGRRKSVPKDSKIFSLDVPGEGQASFTFQGIWR